MSPLAPEAFFLKAANGQRFCLYHAPAGTKTKGALIYLHPFAEEMNKSRRVAAMQSRLLAQHGYAVLQIDLHGCGDSSGDFGDATWQSWVKDVMEANAWLRERCDAPLWLWGLRAGCLLATDAAKQLNSPTNFLFWQPVTAGKLFLQQFLRLKVAGEMLDGKSKGVMAGLKHSLAGGEAVEIAGYTLSSALASGLEAAELRPVSRPELVSAAAPVPSQVIWFELSTRAEATLAPVSIQRIEQWQAAGHTVHSAVLPAPTFWQTSEIEEATVLLDATLAALDALAT
jgi:exosortase A-associated hydrolase 2